MLAMRLIRHRVPHLNSRYISVSDAASKEGRLEFLPLRLQKRNSPTLKAGKTPTKVGDLVVEAGEPGLHRP